MANYPSIYPHTPLTNPLTFGKLILQFELILQEKNDVFVLNQLFTLPPDLNKNK